MKINKNETFEEWSNKVHQFEYGRALMKLANGEEPNELIEEMSQRIIQKLNHPIITTVLNAKLNYNSEKSQQSYKENYTDRFGLKSDHINK